MHLTGDFMLYVNTHYSMSFMIYLNINFDISTSQADNVFPVVAPSNTFKILEMIYVILLLKYVNITLHIKLQISSSS